MKKVNFMILFSSPFCTASSFVASMFYLPDIQLQEYMEEGELLLLLLLYKNSTSKF